MIPFLVTVENFRLVKATGFSFTDLIVDYSGNVAQPFRPARNLGM